ncbi:hypothetical protein BCR32DRAFT_215618 [Anaeromyces robustus]|uniref:Sulfhydryl oxidase n=1 Tax=Anaeromyces robustus TaxID=1754192 RepID=A0A1Y1XMS9_9FUNG|nr:hypothetical protein BCR32DRAFT_215618 [Anaeromyces robustus]|eukprot:ORX87049.1 hypothetical protein BCR32DRAFT_215618 [Anaeromyces robustus]
MRIKTRILLVVACIITVGTIFYVYPKSKNTSINANVKETGEKFNLDTGINAKLNGGIIMPDMFNTTEKEELGRSTWRLLHTVTARYPNKPTNEEKQALKNWVYLLTRLYPSGECAVEFSKILEANPPDVESRDAASQWACKVHNIINEALGKEQFNCNLVGDRWKCGCANDDEEGAEGEKNKNTEKNKIVEENKEDKDK